MRSGDTLLADIERSDHYQSWSDVCDEWKNYAKTDTLEQNLWGTRDSMPAYRNVVEGVCGLKVDNDKLDHFAPAS